MSTQLSVAGISVRQDAEGRYCLKDLHQAAIAAGFNRRSTEPNSFLRKKEAQKLVAELRSETTQNLGNLITLNQRNLGEPILTERGRTGNTYVVKELVYAYAMWVSPAFHLKVIRAYDALVTGEFIQPGIQAENYWFARRPHWPPIRLRVLAGEAYRDIAAALQISRGRVARAVRGMIRVGLLAPLRVAEMQRGPARKAALNYSEGWGRPTAESRQLGLFDALPA